MPSGAARLPAPVDGNGESVVSDRLFMVLSLTTDSRVIAH